LSNAHTNALATRAKVKMGLCYYSELLLASLCAVLLTL